MFETLPINAVDVGVLIELVLGGLIGLALGFARAALFIASWLGAGLATLYGLPMAQIHSRQFIEDEFSADLTAGVAIFLVTLVCLFLISSIIGGWVRKSRLNALDRSLGMVAGFTTSAFLLAIALLVIENIWPGNKQPKVIQEAKSLPMIRLSAGYLNDILPKKLKTFSSKTVGDAASQTKKAIKKGIYDRLMRPDTINSGSEERTGYDNKERHNMENTIDRLNQNLP